MVSERTLREVANVSADNEARARAARGMKVLHLPPNYSEADSETRDLLLQQLSELQRRYQAEAQVITKAMANIENRYPPRVFLVPDETEQPT